MLYARADEECRVFDKSFDSFEINAKEIWSKIFTIYVKNYKLFKFISDAKLEADAVANQDRLNDDIGQQDMLAKLMIFNNAST